jgi:hypothetical protein
MFFFSFVQVLYGEASGTMLSSTASIIQFKISDQGPPPPVAQLTPFLLRVGNRGNAGFAIAQVSEQLFALLPVISDLAPYQGSVGGGTLITITGSGFSPNVVVSIDKQFIMRAYTEIICPCTTLRAQY